MKRNKQDGFTLVEMLVVIGIIAALAGLILPAILGANAEAKNGVCKLQLKDLANAMNYHQNSKGYYPGYAKIIARRQGDPIPVGWVPQLFRYMDRMQEYQTIIAGVPGTEDRWQKIYRNLICPSANPDIGVELEGGTVDETLDLPFTYAMNCGQDSSTVADADNRKTAIGHDHTLPKDQRVYVNLDDIVDGKSQTILMTENADLANWTIMDSTPAANIEFMQGVIFDAGPITPAAVQFNNPRVAWTVELPSTSARPWSYHAGGFNVAYADGHVDGFQIDETEPDISYRLYRAQMTPGCGDDETIDDWENEGCN